jgi:hypothetical protein
MARRNSNKQIEIELLKKLDRLDKMIYHLFSGTLILRQIIVLCFWILLSIWISAYYLIISYGIILFIAYIYHMYSFIKWKKKHTITNQ